MTALSAQREAPSRRAVFLDRDGVLNRNVFYADTQAWESPRTAGELRLAAGASDALRMLQRAGFQLILVSNQPNAVNGKSTFDELAAVHDRLLALLGQEGASLDAIFYCHHHPKWSGPCVCRKPSPHFLLQAAKRFALELGECWMIGDRATDIECGQSAGTRTIWVDTGEGNSRPQANGYAAHVGAAARLILADLC